MVNLKIKSRKDPDHAGGLTCAKEHSAVESALKAVSACFHKADLARQQAKKEGSDPKAAESSAEEVKVDESALKAAEKEAEVAE
jgi:copper chaperone CopZ